MTWVKLHEALRLIAVRKHEGCPDSRGFDVESFEIMQG